MSKIRNDEKKPKESESPTTPPPIKFQTNSTDVSINNLGDKGNQRKGKNSE